MSRIRVGVLFGGQSSEHEVSLSSARSVMAAMDPEKYEVVPIGITKSGAWLATGDPMAQLRGGDSAASLPRLSSVLAPDPSGGGKAEIVHLTLARNGRSSLSAQAGKPIDVIFPVLHGPFGEDGAVQGLLELAGIPYVGAGVLGSAVGMDKVLMKEIFTSRGLPVAPFIAFSRKGWRSDPEAVQKEAETRLTYPMFAKPSNMGSSVGVSKIHGPGEFVAAVDLAAKYDRRILVEQGLLARECECAVLGNENAQASVVGEIIPGNEFYDYRAKYVDDNSDLHIPADLPDDLAGEIRRLAVEAFKAVDGAGMARVDFFVEHNLANVWLNEINTIPGFTRISMYPKLWEASGLPYPDLIDRLIMLAMERHEDREESKRALDEPGAELNV